MDSPSAGDRPSRTGSQEVRQRLERSRERAKRRREQARQTERVIAVEIKKFIASWQAIKVCETNRDKTVEALRAEIAATEAQAEADIGIHHARQAAVAIAIRDLGHSDDEVAELLEISAKEARQLIAKGRSNSSARPPQHASNRRTEPTKPPSTLSEGSGPVTGGRSPHETPTSAASSGAGKVSDQPSSGPVEG